MAVVCLELIEKPVYKLRSMIVHQFPMHTPTEFLELEKKKFNRDHVTGCITELKLLKSRFNPQTQPWHSLQSPGAVQLT